MSQSRKLDPKSHRGSITHEDVMRIAGPLDDESTALILAAQPTAEELEEAVAWAKGETDVMHAAERALKGTVARIYELLTTDEAFEER